MRYSISYLMGPQLQHENIKVIPFFEFYVLLINYFPEPIWSVFALLEQNKQRGFFLHITLNLLNRSWVRKKISIEIS